MALEKDTRSAGSFKAEYSFMSTDKRGKPERVKGSGLIGEHASIDKAFAAAQRLYNSRGFKVHRVFHHVSAA